MRDVDVPEEVITAHRVGDLVLFVGAGASVDAPSSLPTFVELTEKIALESGRELSDADRARPDRYLGELHEQHGVEVHRRVADRLSPAGSQPNALHTALTDLGVAGSAVRIITTNYDLHLSTELASRSPDSPRYTAPALPVGDNFSGLVYLHGALDHLTASLVVTDRDFGRAYLTDAWAARFLERMFGRFVVLFVGYSHEDLVMTYLARGLGRASRRYALTNKPDSVEWRRLGIQPIGYARTDSGGHDALPAAIAAWAKRASMGLLEHRSHIADLLSTAPSDVPEESSYLENVVRDPDTVRFFTEYADGPEWLQWLTRQPTFVSLFDAAAPSTAVSQALATWFVSRFVMDETRLELALELLARHGGRMSADLWHSIGLHLHAGPKPRPAWLNRWLTVLLRDPPEYTSDWLEYALVASQWPQDRAVALALFDHLTEPHPSISGAFGPLSVRTGVTLAGSQNWLREAWEKILLPQIADIAPDVIAIVDHHLRRANQLMRAAGAATNEWDSISYRRKGIEPNPQDAYPDPIDVVIDAARDAIVHLIRQTPGVAHAWLEAWQEAPVPLLRRLATHAWRVREDRSMDDKLAWLYSKQLLYNTEQHHDVYQLLKSVGEASDEAVATLLAVVLAGPEDYGEYTTHAIVNLLAWLAEHAPAKGAIQSAYAAFRADHEDVEPRTHLDYLSWGESGSIGRQPPMTAETLHERLSADATAVVTELLVYRDSDSPHDGTMWHDVTSLVAATVRQWPADGFTIVAEAARHDENERSLVEPVIEGWAAAELTDAQAAQVLLHLLGRTDLAELRDEIARLLADRHPSSGEGSIWPSLLQARELASKLWDTQGDGDDDEGASSEDGLTRVAWHWGSHLAEFWIQAVAADWRAAGDGWRGMDQALRVPLDCIIDANATAGDAGRSTLATRLHFLFRADQEWTGDRLLPLFDWASPELAAPVWTVFIAWGGWNDALLGAGLIDGYIEAARRSSVFEDQIRERLLDHLASISLRSEINPVTSGWLRRFTVGVDEVETRAAFWRHIGWELGGLPREVAERRWSEWMQPYWTARLQSIPIMLTKAEASAMATWIPGLGASVSAAIELAVRHEAGFEQHSGLLHDLAASELLSTSTSEVSGFVAHLLAGTESPFYGCYDVAKIINVVRSITAVEPETIIEQALRLGCPASTWEKPAS
ncbi:MAG: DUF4020 domain-containing protein [Actinobacteria bacterium]|nr:DUF4020 domain-containing protein [Actinomycetota bacterium]